MKLILRIAYKGLVMTNNSNIQSFTSLNGAIKVTKLDNTDEPK